MGNDSLTHYRISSAYLSKISEFTVETGVGPRHVVFDEDRNQLLMSAELSSELHVISFEG